jgi:hypothetical protein
MEEINQRLLFDSSNYFDREFNIGSLSTLSLNEVGVIIQMKDIEGVKRWLNSNDVKVYKRSKFNYVYKIDVECEIDKVRVRDLRKSFPNEWEMRYQLLQRTCGLHKMVVLSLGGELNYMATSKVERESVGMNNYIKANVMKRLTLPKILIKD